jgi:hypothetical protein
MIDGSLGVTLGVVGEHAIKLEVGLLTVHDIDPAGLNPVVPVTIAVKVVVPPRVGEADEEMVIVGTRFEIAIVELLEVTAT